MMDAGTPMGLVEGGQGRQYRLIPPSGRSHPTQAIYAINPTVRILESPE